MCRCNCLLLYFVYMNVHVSACISVCETEKGEGGGRLRVSCIITCEWRLLIAPEASIFWCLRRLFKKSDMVLWSFATFLYFNHVRNKTWAWEPECASHWGHRTPNTVVQDNDWHFLSSPECMSLTCSEHLTPSSVTSVSHNLLVPSQKAVKQ